MGTSLLDIYNDLNVPLSGKPFVVQVNNVTRDLKFRIYNPKRIEFQSNDVAAGRRAYVRSLSFILCKAFYTLFPGAEIRLDHPIANGYYCKLLRVDKKITKELTEQIKAEMRKIIAMDYPFVMRMIPTEEAIATFEKRGATDVSLLLKSLGELYTKVYELDGLMDWYIGPLAPSTGYVDIFDLTPYKDGMFLRVPDRKDTKKLSEEVNQDKLFGTFSEYTEWNEIMGLSNVGNMNSMIQKKRVMSDVIKVAEALQEKKITKIADDICERGTVKLVLVSGPSSSGKTTFSKRLSIALAVNGKRPTPLSMDDYFVSRDKTPRDEHGDYDFESLYALDLELFNDHLKKMLAGEEVSLPTFNFETGMREYRGNTIKLGENDILVIEGIHALNPTLTSEIPSERKFKVYVSALTTISFDNHNWIPTTDNRLLRRIIRDYKYRGYSAIDTISRWPKVNAGEEKWIFPYQENADVMFNSALIFELSVLKKFAEPILSEVPQNCVEYSEVHRLQNFLKYFTPIQETEIPFTSLLREFLGGSTFSY
jgi:uridine kinase